MSTAAVNSVSQVSNCADVMRAVVRQREGCARGGEKDVLAPAALLHRVRVGVAVSAAVPEEQVGALLDGRERQGDGEGLRRAGAAHKGRGFWIRPERERAVRQRCEATALGDRPEGKTVVLVRRSGEAEECEDQRLSSIVSTVGGLARQIIAGKTSMMPNSKWVFAQ